MATDIIISTNQSVQQGFADNDQSMIIQTGVVVQESVASTIYTNFLRDHLLNHGFIVSELRGVMFDVSADQGLVHNFADGVIMAPEGVLMSGTRSTLVNDGAIIGLESNGVDIENAVKASVTNAGTIVGEDHAVRFLGGGLQGLTLRNTGLLRSESNGVMMNIDPGATLTVTNAAGAVIRGLYAFEVFGGRLDLTNHGTIAGLITDEGGQSTTIRNDGRITGFTSLGGGADTFNGAGGVQNGVHAGAGTDRVIGGTGADWMDGGADRDILTGGKGPDRFHFQTASDSAPGATCDFITDFSRGQKDRIDIGDMSGTTFAFRGGHGFGGGVPSVRFETVNKPGTANDRTIILGDANGDGTADFQIALKGLIALKAGDFYL